MKQAILFILSFAVLSLALTWLWLAGGNVLYARLMTPIAGEIYDALGLQGHGTMGRTRFINLVPFASLMLLTPKLSWRRRFGGLVLGSGLIMLSHIAFNGAAIVTQTPRRLPRVGMLVSDAMPFVLWYVFAREFLKDTLSKIRRGRNADDSNDHHRSSQ